MAQKSDFTEEEWQLIVAAAPMMGLAVTCASPNGPLGVMKEMLSMGMAMAEIIQRGSDNPLIASLIADLKERKTRIAPPPDLKDADQGRSAALDQARQLAALLHRKVPEAEADEFKLWLMSVAKRVAEAAHEGGFFGIGGERVSDAEKQVMRQLAFTFGLSVDVVDSEASTKS